MERRKFSPHQMGKLLRSDGALCVTFANTAEREELKSYEDWLAWSIAAGTLSQRDAAHLSQSAAQQPARATGVVHQVRASVRRLQRMLGTLAEGKEIDSTELEAFNRDLCHAMSKRPVVATPRGCRWSWEAEAGSDFDRFLWPILNSTADLLVSGQSVRQCACGIFFVASGGGRPRKFCSRSCVNRSTSRKHYHKSVKPRRRRRLREARSRQRAALAGYGDKWQASDSEDV